MAEGAGLTARRTISLVIDDNTKKYVDSLEKSYTEAGRREAEEKTKQAEGHEKHAKEVAVRIAAFEKEKVSPEERARGLASMIYEGELAQMVADSLVQYEAPRIIADKAIMLARGRGEWERLPGLHDEVFRLELHERGLRIRFATFNLQAQEAAWAASAESKTPGAPSPLERYTKELRDMEKSREVLIQSQAELLRDLENELAVMQGNWGRAAAFFAAKTGADHAMIDALIAGNRTKEASAIFLRRQEASIDLLPPENRAEARLVARGKEGIAGGNEKGAHLFFLDGPRKAERTGSGLKKAASPFLPKARSTHLV